MLVSRVSYLAIGLVVWASVAEASPGLDSGKPTAGDAPAAASTSDEPKRTNADPLLSTAETLETAVTAPVPALAPMPAVTQQAPPARPVPPPVTLVAKVDLSAQRLTVVVNDKTRHTWPISSGAQGYATPVGTFRPDWMAKMWYSRQYDDAPMPHAVFFKEGAAIHATQAIGSLGRPASHGCVRLAPAHAEIFYKLVARHTLAQTRVHVFGTPRYTAPMVARAPQRSASVFAHGPAPVSFVNGYRPASGFSGGPWRGTAGYSGTGLGPRTYVQPIYIRPAPVIQVARPRSVVLITPAYRAR